MIIYGTKQTVERYGMKMPEVFQDVYRKINGKWLCAVDNSYGTTLLD